MNRVQLHPAEVSGPRGQLPGESSLEWGCSLLQARWGWNCGPQGKKSPEALLYLTLPLLGHYWGPCLLLILYEVTCCPLPTPQTSDPVSLKAPSPPCPRRPLHTLAFHLPNSCSVWGTWLPTCRRREGGPPESIPALCRAREAQGGRPHLPSTLATPTCRPRSPPPPAVPHLPSTLSTPWRFLLGCCPVWDGISKCKIGQLYFFQVFI